MHDIIFCSVPYSSLDQIYSAPAILKAVAISNGYTAKTMEFGPTLLAMANNDVELFNRIQNYFVTPGNVLTIDENVILTKFYDYIIQFFKDNPSKYIGLSIFSIYTHKSIIDILKLCKQHNITSKIVVGGRGAKVPIYTVISSLPIEQHIGFGDLLKSRKLVDYVIIGDGEDAILDVLRNTAITKINHVTDTFNYPIPNYDDYKFDEYLWGDSEVMFPILGSKGCVRNCDFCDVKYQFGKYRYRTGEDIAREMIYIAETLNFRKFQFTDSLVNGGLKPLEEFCTIIADYNLHNPNKKISWNGQYICREATAMPARLYKLMADAGAHGLTVGAESGSNRVLLAMNKKTTVEALYAELEQFRKHNITCTLLTFVGHWSEEYDDFVEHCKMLINIMPYVRSGTISAVSLGLTAFLPAGTPARNSALTISEFNSEAIWFNKQNPENTFKERLYRRLLLTKLATNLKIPLTDEYTWLNMLNSIIEVQHNQINEFYDICN